MNNVIDIIRDDTDCIENICFAHQHMFESEIIWELIEWHLWKAVEVMKNLMSFQFYLGAS